MADEPTPTARRRPQPAPPVIEGSARVIAEEPVDRRKTPPHVESPSNDGAAPTHADAPAPADAAAEASPRAEVPAVDDSDAGGPAERRPQLQDEVAHDVAANGTGHSQPPDPALAPEGEAPQPRASAAATRPRWWIYVLGGIAVGAALVAIAWFGPFGSNGPTPPGVDPRSSAMDSKLVSSEESIATLDRRLAALEASVEQLTSAQKDLADTIASTSRNLDHMNASLSAAANTAKAATAAAQTAQADAAEARSMSRSAVSADAGKTVDLKPLQDRIVQIEAVLAQPKLEGKSTADPAVPPDTNSSLDHAAALAVIAQTLIQAIDHGEPFPRQVAALETLGADANQLAMLRPLSDSGVPTAQSLRVKFADLVKNIGPVAGAPESGSFFSKIWQETTHLVRVRPVGGAESEVGALAARVEAALAGGDAAGALAEWEKLPAPVKNISQKWAAELQSRADAVAAASAVLASAIGTLGKPKS
jgi:hypothetical protein